MSDKIEKNNVTVLQEVLNLLRSFEEVRVDGFFYDGERYWDSNKCPSCGHSASPSDKINHAEDCKLIEAINKLEAYVEAEKELEKIKG